MKKFEIIMVTLCIAVVSLKMLNLPGIPELVVLSFFVLIGFYTFFSFALFNEIPFRQIFRKSSYSAISWGRIIGTVGFGFALGSGVITAILYQIQQWPAADALTINNLKVLGIVVVVALFFYFRKKQPFYTKIFIRAAIAGTISVVTLLF